MSAAVVMVVIVAVVVAVQYSVGTYQGKQTQTQLVRESSSTATSLSHYRLILALREQLVRAS